VPIRTLLAGALCLALLVILVVNRARPPVAPELTLEPVDFAALDGWSDDDVAAGLATFASSCGRFLNWPADRPIGRRDVYGTAGLWASLCEEARALIERGDGSAARAFLETNFVPVALGNGAERDGLFTGYYEPELHGARSPHGHFTVPLYRVPEDLLVADLGDFQSDLAGRRIAGRVEDGRLVPYATRAEINGGALAERGLELLWVDDPVDAFFLEIQGSGRVVLDTGETIRVGYAGQNGDLIETGEIARADMSMQAIGAWLNDHPDRATEMMQRNPSVVFFAERPELADADGPQGAMGLPLTAGRSLAVDPAFVPLGVPLWLETRIPGPDGEEPLRRLVVAQDTGGAIRGAVRGDLFFGSDGAAAAAAGHMRHQGRYTVLLPTEVASALPGS
jgi:membrane-bound lytic murein transglycosylase A